jgi:hypothetical protein
MFKKSVSRYGGEILNKVVARVIFFRNRKLPLLQSGLPYIHWLGLIFLPFYMMSTIHVLNCVVDLCMGWESQISVFAFGHPATPLSSPERASSSLSSCPPEAKRYLELFTG